MKRYPAFDPPEYVDWTPDATLVREYGEHLRADPDRSRIMEQLSENDLLAMYRDLLRTRLHDIGLKRWVHTGIISKAWLGTGEDAVTVGSVSALVSATDIVCPMIRYPGAMHIRNPRRPAR
jgi:TPP-dependent pyruvate/acetoin dehydrogenase alpha subunit